jgi:phosphatidylinositol 4-kinase
VYLPQRQLLTLPSYSDPFFVKEEFAPTDKDALLREAHAASELLAPHSRLLYFLSSHYNANRLGSIDVQRIFTRWIQKTTEGLRHSTTHPLARGLRLQVIIFGLKICQHNTTLPQKAGWHLKTQLLKAALEWFRVPPCWSFGSNRLQLKAEVQLLQELKNSLLPQDKGDEPLPPYLDLEKLLRHFLSHEEYRLDVWLNPMGRVSSQKKSDVACPEVSAYRNTKSDLILCSHRVYD